MKYTLIIALAVLLAGCGSDVPQAPHFSQTDLIGKTLKDKDGCVFAVTRDPDNYYHVKLLPLVDDSADTCSITKLPVN